MPAPSAGMTSWMEASLLPTLILLGVIGRPHGVRGLVHVTSHTDPPQAIASYGPLLTERGQRLVLRWRGENLAEIAELTDGQERRVADRAAAERLTNTRLFIERDRLPETGEDEFYLADLIGLAALDKAGGRVGEVAGFHDYGAGVSLEIARHNAGPLLVPFTKASVPVVDLAGGRVVVDPPVEIDVPPTPSPGVLTHADLSREAGEVDRITSPASRERSPRLGAGGEGAGGTK